MNKLLLNWSVVLVLTVALCHIHQYSCQKTEAECTGEHEFWGCQSMTKECQRLCENREIRRNGFVCKLKCERACVCEAGYLRNGVDGECVYDSECPKVLTDKELDAKKDTNKEAKVSPPKEQKLQPKKFATESEDDE